MKKEIASLALATFALTACGTTSSVKYEGPDYGPNPMENPEYMQAMMEAGMPGEEHTELTKGVGYWNVTGTHWMTPDGEGIPMEATATVKELFGGRYITQEFKMSWEGMPFEGMLIMGFNKNNGEYFNMWIDNMSTGYSIATGYEDEEGAIHMHGTAYDPLAPGGRPFRTVTWDVSDNEFVMQMWGSTSPDGEEFKQMEMTYKR